MFTINDYASDSARTAFFPDLLSAKRGLIHDDCTADTEEMLGFCDRHNIVSDIEAIPIQRSTRLSSAYCKGMCETALSSIWCCSRPGSAHDPYGGQA
jgi:hypothetical protein